MNDPLPLPSFALPAVQVVNTLAFERDAKFIIVFFDKRGPEFCKARLQAFQEILPQLKAAGFQVFGISTDDDLAKTAEWAREIGVEFPLLSDVGGVVSGRFGLLNSLDGRSERALAIIEQGTVRHRETVDHPNVPETVLQLIK
jgi:peroxiredoxin Q/BCP